MKFSLKAHRVARGQHGCPGQQIHHLAYLLTHLDTHSSGLIFRYGKSNSLEFEIFSELSTMLQELHEDEESADFFASDDTPLSFFELGATLIVPPLEELECSNEDSLSRLHMRLFVRVGNKIEELSLVPQDRLVLGRVTPNGPRIPNVDLTDFNALQLGVSRLHAVIENHDNIFTITDLYSSNGTLLNGCRLEPNEIRFLHDGDTVCMGKLVIYVRICASDDE